MPAFVFFSRLDEVTLVSAYRSPSMSIDDMDDFFDCLCAILGELVGKVLLVGDLNIEKSRNFRDRRKQDVLLNRIRQVGFQSRFSGPTFRGNQLDYVFRIFQGYPSKMPAMWACSLWVITRLL